MIVFILLLALILRIWNINQSFWLDEAAQAIQSSKPLLEMLNNMSADFHPPLYYILFHFWMYLGHSEVVMRFFPILIGLLSIYVTYIFSRDLFNFKVAILSALFLAINPFHIYFSQEVRPYILSCLLGILSTYTFWKSLHSQHKFWLVGFCLSTSAAFYNSYLAIFLTIGQVSFLIIKFKEYKYQLLPIFLSLLAAVVLFLPWLPQVPAQLLISQGLSRDLPGWIDAVSTPVLKATPLTIVKFIIGQISFSPTWVYGLIVILITALWCFVILRGKSLKNAWVYLFSTFLVTFGVSIFFSIFLQVVAPKRLIFILPLLTIMLASGIVLYRRLTFFTILSLLAISNFIFIAIYQTNPYFQRENWRDAVIHIEKLSDNQTAVLFKFSAPFAPYTWYQTKELKLVSLGDPLVVSENKLQETLKDLKDEKTIFVFDYLGGLTDPQNLTDLRLNRDGYIKVDTFNFSGVGLIHLYQKL